MSYPDTITANFSARDLNASLHPLIAGRWSPRAFKKTAISAQDIDTLFEAARCAPSCFNAQPWQFYLSNDSNFDQYLSLLVDANQVWARNASLICFVVVKKTFDHNGQPNMYAEFDAGAAWMSVALQARQMGLYTHGMGGIKHDEIAHYLGLDDDHKVICGFVIGVADTADTLPAEIAAKEIPSARKPLSQILRR